MRRNVRLWSLRSTAAACLMLGGCGGGGGVSSTPTPTPAPAPAPSPPASEPPPPVTPTPAAPAPPTIPTTNFDDSEYRRSNAATAANAITAYRSGATGAGVKIAVLDSGLADTRGEFAGRVDPASRDVASNRGIVDTDGHGTSVAAVAAAGRTGNDILGVAFDASLIVLRTDDPGSCANEGKCNHNTGILAQAVDIATQNGARVINMSLGGAAASTSLRQAVSRATAAGVIVIISAGNDGNSEPDELPQVASDGGAKGLVIIAGSHEADGTISSFSDQAGSFAQYYLTALGGQVRAFDHTGGAFLFSGTSYSAPAIAGAVALLASAFPNLSGPQIVNLLFSTATDAGDAGVDRVFGRGILNLTRAFQPQGATSLAGSAVPVSLDQNAALGTAMGDAGGAGSASLGAVILDSYARAYTLDLAATVRTAPAARPLFGAIGGDFRTAALAAGTMAVSVTISRNDRGEPWAGLAQLGLTRNDSRAAHAVAGAALARIDAKTAAAFGFGETGKSLVARLAQSADTPFLVARGPADRPGFDARRGTALALRRTVGAVGVTVAAEQGRVAAVQPRGAEPNYAVVTLSADRRFGPLRLSVGGGLLREQGTVLGARFGPALGLGSQTRLVDLGGAVEAGGGWRRAAQWRRGWTRAEGGPATIGAGRLTSSAYAVDVTKAGLLVGGDRFGLRLSQPLRVSAGGYRLNLPVSYDYATGTTGYAERLLDLAPTGRERDVELAYGRGIGRGWIDANLYLRQEPGNFAAAPDDLGLALRFTTAF
ncbi:MAG: peptidase [Sphingomonas bacterium]|nr:peptidase [Sphingomonas bacterium]